MAGHGSSRDYCRRRRRRRRQTFGGKWASHPLSMFYIHMYVGTPLLLLNVMTLDFDQPCLLRVSPLLFVLLINTR